jgi:hypothetical protein
VVAKGRHPTLMGIGVGRALWHISSNGALLHIEAEHLKLAVNTRRSPGWVLISHAADQTTDFSIHPWPTIMPVP